MEGLCKTPFRSSKLLDFFGPSIVFEAASVPLFQQLGFSSLSFWRKYSPVHTSEPLSKRPE